MTRRRFGRTPGKQISHMIGAAHLHQHKPETEAGGNEHWTVGAASRREKLFFLCEYHLHILHLLVTTLFASGLTHPKFLHNVCACMCKLLSMVFYDLYILVLPSLSVGFLRTHQYPKCHCCGWGDVSTSQRMPKTSSKPSEDRRNAWNRFSLWALEGTNQTDT